MYVSVCSIFSRLYLVWSRLCYRLMSVVWLVLPIVAKWCVLEQKVLLTAYRKLYMRS